MITSFFIIDPNLPYANLSPQLAFNRRIWKCWHEKGAGDSFGGKLLTAVSYDEWALESTNLSSQS